MKVESKYRNPDGYIERLKSRNKTQSESIGSMLTRNGQIRSDNERRLDSIRGEVFVTWKDGVIASQTCTSAALGAFRVGDKMLNVSRIISVKEFTKPDGSVSSEVECRLLRTRRVEDSTI